MFKSDIQNVLLVTIVMCQAKYIQLKPEKILYVSLRLDGLCTENYKYKSIN